MSCHAILENLYEPKMEVILTISFKLTAEIEMTKHMFCVLLCRRGRVSAFVKHNYVLSLIHCHGKSLHCFFFLLLIARLMRRLPAEVPWKRDRIKDFSPSLRNLPLWCSADSVSCLGEVASSRRCWVRVQLYTLFFIPPFFLSFPVFCVVVFIKYIPK